MPASAPHVPDTSPERLILALSNRSKLLSGESSVATCAQETLTGLEESCEDLINLKFPIRTDNPFRPLLADTIKDLVIACETKRIAQVSPVLLGDENQRTLLRYLTWRINDLETTMKDLLETRGELSIRDAELLVKALSVSVNVRIEKYPLPKNP